MLSSNAAGFASKSVYEFVRSREVRRVWATKGMEGPGRQIIQIANKRNKSGVRLALVGVDVVKEALYSRLNLKEFGPGYIHFPPEVDEEYFRQLTAEQVKTKFVRGYARRVWEKVRARNEALDCAVLAFAALTSLQIGHLTGFADRIDKERMAATEARRGKPDKIPPTRRGLLKPPTGKGGWIGRY